MARSSGLLHRPAATELSILCLLALWTLSLNGLGLGATDFIRHTEADRTLIAWEMLERRDFLVPHLLGSVILTKPPLYYWLAAAALWLSGSADEWSARLVSYAASVLYVLGQYLFWRLAGFERMISAASAFFLSASLSVVLLSSLAEIDMLFGLLCTFSLYALYLSLQSGSIAWTLLAYLLLALGFLAKGPPALFFFASSAVLFCIYQRWSSAGGAYPPLPKIIALHAGGIVLCCALIGAWLVPLALQVGWRSLGQQLEAEVFERVMYQSSRPRGPFFYFASITAGLLPWSLPALFGLPAACRPYTLRTLSGRHRSFFAFSLFVAFSALLMLSMAEGKSSRYIFPVHAFIFNLALFCIYALRGTLHDRVYRLGAVLAGVVAVGAPLLAVTAELEGVSRAAMLQSACVLSLCAALVGLACSKRHASLALAGLALLMVGVRFTQYKIYSPHRNATRSVQLLAAEIDRAVPSAATIYTVELFERWINYYLKLRGRNSERLTPESARRPASISGRAYLLLSLEEEAWRLLQLQYFDRAVAVRRRFEGPKGSFLLLEVSAAALPYLEPQRDFPTVPSRPFYSELRRLQ